MSASFRIAPATLGYLRDCERCFVREVRDRIRRPGGPSPMFAFADRAMKRAFDVPEAVWIDVGVREAPRFRPLAQGFAVTSAPVRFPDLGVSLTLAGNLDAFVETDDGRRMLIDYKTTPGDPGVARYAGQFGYAFALEHPAADAVCCDDGGRHGAAGLPSDHLRREKEWRRRAVRAHGVAGGPQDAGRLLGTMRRVANLLSGTTRPKRRLLCLLPLLWCVGRLSDAQPRPCSPETAWLVTQAYEASP